MYKLPLGPGPHYPHNTKSLQLSTQQTRPGPVICQVMVFVCVHKINVSISSVYTQFKERGFILSESKTFLICSSSSFGYNENFRSALYRNYFYVTTSKFLTVKVLVFTLKTILRDQNMEMLRISDKASLRSTSNTDEDVTFRLVSDDWPC